MIWSKIKSYLGLLHQNQYYNADFYSEYLNSLKKHDSNQLISDQSFVVFDTETTGLNPEKDQILSIGAVRIFQQSIEVSDSLSIIIANQPAQNHDATTIHGLVNTASQGIQQEEAIAKFFKYIGSDILVVHHVAFDLTMINNLSRQCGGGQLKNPTLDTSYLAKRLDHATDPHSLESNAYTLDKLCTRYNVIPKARHTADGDAFITALVFIKILQRLHHRGINTRGQLLK